MLPFVYWQAVGHGFSTLSSSSPWSFGVYNFVLRTRSSSAIIVYFTHPLPDPRDSICLILELCTGGELLSRLNTVVSPGRFLFCFREKALDSNARSDSGSIMPRYLPCLTAPSGQQSLFARQRWNQPRWGGFRIFVEILSLGISVACLIYFFSECVWEVEVIG